MPMPAILIEAYAEQRLLLKDVGDPRRRKRCKRCQAWKDELAFSPAQRTKDGRQAICKTCRNEMAKEKKEPVR